MDAQTRTWSKRRPLNYRRGKRQWEAELQMVTETQRREKQKSPNLFRSPTVSMELPLFGFYLGAVSLAKKQSPLFLSGERTDEKWFRELQNFSLKRESSAPYWRSGEKLGHTSWAPTGRNANKQHGTTNPCENNEVQNMTKISVEQVKSSKNRTKPS